MLGTVVAQDRVGEMAFQQIGRPALPVGEKAVECGQGVFMRVPADEFDGAGRRSGAGVEHGDDGFAAGESRIDDGQVADDDGEEGEAHAGFEHGERAGDSAAGCEVAIAESEESDAAVIDVGYEVQGAVGRGDGGTGGPDEESEAGDKAGGPGAEQKEQRERAENAQEPFPALGIPDTRGRG